MRIGVFGDTHDRVVNVERACAVLNDARVDRVVHTGDITTVSTLRLLHALDAPAAAVLGNNDHDRDELLECGASMGFQMASHSLDLTWCSRRIFVIHDPEDPAATRDDCDLILHGHTHRTRIEWIRREAEQTDTLVVSPGECASAHPGRNRVAIVDLQSMTTELIEF